MRILWFFAAAAIAYAGDHSALLQRATELFYRNEFREAEKIAREVWSKTDPRTDAATYYQAANTLGVALFILGREAEAERLLRQAELANPASFADHEADAMRAMSNLGQVMAAQGDAARAEPVLKRTLWWFEKNQPHDWPQLAIEHHNLGSLYLQEWRHPEARKHLEQAALLWSAAHVPETNVNALETRAALALLESRTGHLDRAERLLQDAWQIAESLHLPPQHPLPHSILLNRAMLRVQQGRLREARTLAEQSLRVQWSVTQELPNGFLMRSIALYKEILKHSKDRASLQRLSRWNTALEHGRRKYGDDGDCAR